MHFEQSWQVAWDIGNGGRRILPSTKQAFCLNLQIWQCGELQAPAFTFPFNLVHIALIGRPPVRWVQNAGVRFVEPLKLRLWRRQFVTMDRRRKFRTLFIVDVLYLCFLRHRRGLLFILYGQFWPSRYLCSIHKKLSEPCWQGAESQDGLGLSEAQTESSLGCCGHIWQL